MAWTLAELRRLARRAGRQEFVEGGVIFREGDPGDRVLLIRRGLVEIYTESLVGRRRLSLRGRGDVIGEMALLDGQGRSASALARTAVQVRSLQRAAWDELLQAHPSLFGHLSRELSQRMRQLQATLASELDRRDAGAAQAGMSTIGPYRLLEPLGEGGMGVVYAAVHRSSGRARAVKVLPVHTVQQRSRFQLECESMARLVHPNIVRIDSGGVEGANGYVAMELLQGQTLEQRLARGRLPEHECGAWFGPALRALAHAHQQGVVHRDLKPANLFLTREGTLKVLDFGIARRVNGPQLTVEGRFFGTPAYLAPERVGATARQYERQSDQYALGITMYRALTGRLPYESDDVAQILVGHMTATPTPPSELAPLSPELEAFVLQLMARDPLRRFASCEEAAQRLEEIVGEGHQGAEAPTGEYFNNLLGDDRT